MTDYKALCVDQNADEEIEEFFLDWINSNCSAYTFLLEYFYDDVEIEDYVVRRDMMYKWLLAAYKEGFLAGRT